MDHLSQPVIPSLVFLLCQDAGFTYVVNCFVSITT